MLAPLRAAPPPFPLVFHRRTSPNLNATSAWCPISDMGLPFQFDIAEFPRSARFDAVAQSQRLLLAPGGLRSAPAFRLTHRAVEMAQSDGDLVILHREQQTLPAPVPLTIALTKCD